MTKAELAKALEIARSDQDLSHVDVSTLDGYALSNFKATSVSIEMVASVIRWQCIQLNGEIVAEELDQLAKCFRRKVTILEN